MQIINNSYKNFTSTYYTDKNNIYAPILQNAKKLHQANDKSPLMAKGIITKF